MNPARRVRALRRHMTKTTGAIFDKRNSNDCLCLIGLEKVGYGKAA
jgi:hypothetical protein